MKIFAIINPESGIGESDSLTQLIYDSFCDFEINVGIVSKTTSVKELAKQAVNEQSQILLVAGGDGTISQVISVIADSDITLGLLPLGTGNLLAINLGIPLNIEKSIEIIKAGHSKKIDLGEINGKYFSLLAGCGFDVRIIGSTKQAAKKRFGFLAYIIRGFAEVFKTRNMAFQVSLDSRKPFKARASTIFIANTAKIFGDVLSLAPKASMTDGKLDLIIISSKGFFDYFALVFQMLVGHHYKDKGHLKVYQAKSIEIKTNKKYFIQVDGDIASTTPISAKIRPQALKIFTPEKVCIGSNEMIQKNLQVLFANMLKSLSSLGKINF